jgi:hypothetical protein
VTDIALADLWIYDPATKLWTFLNQNIAVTSAQCLPNNGYPGRLYGSTSWIDACGRFWLYGGQYHYGGPTGSVTFCSDALWLLDQQTLTFKLIDTLLNKTSGNFGAFRTPAPTNSPPPLAFQMPFSDANGNLWVLGGSKDDYGVYNALWCYQINSSCPGNATSAFFLTQPSQGGCGPYTAQFSAGYANDLYHWDFGAPLF